MQEKKQDLGFHAYIRGIILIGFSLLMLGFILTGNIRLYIAPKMMPFMYFATAVFIFLGIVQIIRSTKKGEDAESFCDCGADHSIEGSRIVKVLIYSLFIAPILMGFVLPDKVLDSSIAANRGVQYGGGLLMKPTEGASGGTSRAEAYLEDPEAYLDSIDSQEHYTVEETYDAEGFHQYFDDMADEMSQQGRIMVTEENYLDIMTMLDLHLDRFIGKEMEIVGFVYREPDFKDNQLVVSRFSMTCCVADAAVYGTMVETEDAHLYEDDTWIRVSGPLTKAQYNEFSIPVIQLREVEVIEEPEQPYVFPTFRR